MFACVHVRRTLRVRVRVDVRNTSGIALRNNHYKQEVITEL